jgi:Ca2+-binding RTX toxin-like protein
MHTTSSHVGIFEPLENRRMFSTSFYSGMLFVNGTESADQITVQDTYRSVNINGRFYLDRYLRVTETTGTSTQSREFRAADVSFISINGFGGNDTISAGAGHDTVNGGSGRDYVYGDMSNLGEVGIAQLGTPGNDVINGNGGGDYLYGNDGGDVLRGGAGDDVLQGDAGMDSMFGEAGNDTIFAKDGTGYETVDGGDGTDTAEIDDFLRRITSGPLAGGSIRIRDNVFSVEAVTA